MRPPARARESRGPFHLPRLRARQTFPLPLLGRRLAFPPPRGGGGGGGASSAGEGRVGAFRSMASATSRRRMDPPGPLPLMVPRSIPFALANSSAPSVTSTVTAFGSPFGAVVFPPPLAGEGRVGALSVAAVTVGAFFAA